MQDKREAENERGEHEGLLVGTGSEQAPGVGDASHPAPAAMVREDGLAHVAGESPVGTTPASSGYDPDDTPSGATTEEARERLNAVQEPEQHDIKRPDIGTE